MCDCDVMPCACRRHCCLPLQLGHPDLPAAPRHAVTACSPPTQHLTAGGAVLKLPPDAQPPHIQTLLALVTMCPGDAEDSAGLPPDTYLRTVHLDLSGHALAIEQLRELLLLAPHRLKQCHMLESLVLEGCHLAAGAGMHGRWWSGWGLLRQGRTQVSLQPWLIHLLPANASTLRCCMLLAAAILPGLPQMPCSCCGTGGRSRQLSACSGWCWLATRCWAACSSSRSSRSSSSSSRKRGAMAWQVVQQSQGRLGRA